VLGRGDERRIPVAIDIARSDALHTESAHRRDHDASPGNTSAHRDRIPDIHWQDFDILLSCKVSCLLRGT
jgi:hypothetical protein